MSYEVSGSYMSTKAQPLFVNNYITAIDNPYTFGNSFSVVYDNMTTIAINGQLQVDVNQDFSLAVKGTYYGYDTKVQEEAWNLPDMEAALSLEYKFTDKISAGTSLFYVGQRKDRFQQQNVTPFIPEQTYVLGAYFDANINVTYKINDRFSAYLKGQNLAAQEYEKWQNTPVQGIEVLCGATYKFDF
jgi:outer membrane receptor for ferrienterochelin and colicin